jgi:limonene-1,2-epoxide hydrolase
MSQSNIQIVTDMCNSLLAGDMAKTCEFLSADAVYHNKPWPAVTGHAAIREVLDPFIEGPECALKTMDIHHSAADGDVVLNARSELWERAGASVLLPVAGVFTIRDGLITQWDDYWDSATLQPLLDTL